MSRFRQRLLHGGSALGDGDCNFTSVSNIQLPGWFSRDKPLECIVTLKEYTKCSVALTAFFEEQLRCIVIPFQDESPADLRDLQYLSMRGLGDVEGWLRRPQDPDVADRHGWTLLHCLAHAGDTDGVQLESRLF